VKEVELYLASLEIANKFGFRDDKDDNSSDLTLSCSVDHVPVKLESSLKLDRAITLLDRTPTADTAKIALLYDRHNTTEVVSGETSNQGTSDLLLKPAGGSPPFLTFASKLGTMVKTSELQFFSGGLDTSGFDADGRFAILFMEDGYGGPGGQIILFHTVALMPEGINTRKRHVGNDNVFVIYLDDPSSPLSKSVRRSQREMTMKSSLLSGDFGFVLIFVEFQQSVVRVSVRVRPDLPPNKMFLGLLTGDDIVPTEAAPAYVRQLAFLADMVCRSQMEDILGLCANWEDRFQQLHEMKRYHNNNNNTTR